MRFRKLLPFLVGAGILVAALAHATVFLPFQGGTGTSTIPGAGSVAGGNGSIICYTPSSTTGYVLEQSSTAPCGLAWIAQTGGGGSTTIINGVSGPTFTFSIVNASSASTITTTTAQLFLNLLQYTSGTDINVASNGVINFVNTPGYISTSTGLTTANFASANISQWTNNVPYLTTSTYNASTSIATTAPITGGGQILNNGTLTLGCATCLTTSTGLTTANFATTSISQWNNDAHYVTSTGSGGSSVGSAGYIQYASSTSGQFDATSTFTFTSSTNTLALSSGSSSESIGNKFLYSVTYPYSSATTTFTVPSGVTNLYIIAAGSAGGTATAAGSGVGGDGGIVSSQLSVTAGTHYYIGFLAGGLGDATATYGNGGGYASYFSGSSTAFNASGTSGILLVAPGGGGGGISGNQANPNNGGGGGGAGYGGGGGGGAGISNGGAGGTIGNGTGGNGGTNNGVGSAGTGGAGGGGGGGVSAVNGSAGTNGSTSVNGNGGAGGGTSAGTGGTGASSGAEQAGGGGGGGGDMNTTMGGSGGSNGGGAGGGGVSGNVAAGGGGAGSAYMSSLLNSTSSAYSNTVTSTVGTYIIISYISTTPPPDAILSTDGHIYTGGNAPTVTNGTLIGNDNAGLVNVGSSATTFNLTFTTTWSLPPSCIATVTGGSPAYFSANSSLSGVVFTANSALSVGSQFNYICLGF